MQAWVQNTPGTTPASRLPWKAMCSEVQISLMLVPWRPCQSRLAQRSFCGSLTLCLTTLAVDGIAASIQIVLLELDLRAIVPSGNGKVAPAHVCFEDFAVPKDLDRALVIDSSPAQSLGSQHVVGAEPDCGGRVQT